jgi:hypothetical protein
MLTILPLHYYVYSGGLAILEYRNDNSGPYGIPPHINIYGFGRRLQQWAWDDYTWAYQRRTFIVDGRGQVASVLKPDGSALATKIEYLPYDWIKPC